ncbi:hypothetical protein [Mucilaginibacter rubeus]|uniref:Uncharacterized protein n=1 Tax=Mucilaginibacter rubeus TaxID=2027860 RepID=A0A5C1I6G9_9SPHI|nr:hypothetical protein [Mucilaginibacter rubeus]QEM13464.1 hypothetical protein DEO27_026790 [Mucilaginibacter rubeus]
MKNKEVQWRDVRIFIGGKEVEGIKFDYPVMIGPEGNIYTLIQKPLEDRFSEIWVNRVAKEIEKPANK